NGGVSMNERVPPHNIEAEQAVIGAVFLEPNVFSGASERLVANDFFRANHQVIFEAMFELFEKEEPIDLVTVTTLLSNNKKLEIAVGVSYLTDVESSVLNASSIYFYYSIVDGEPEFHLLIYSES